MSKNFIGQANHVFGKNDMSSLKVDSIEPDPEDRIEPFVTISDRYESFIIINSISQWEQLDVIIRKHFETQG